MRILEVTVPWTEGLHLRFAAQLVRLAKSFNSQIRLQSGSLRAEASSIISIVLLCAAVNTKLEVQVSGDDEAAAAEAIEQFFSADAA